MAAKEIFAIRLHDLREEGGISRQKAADDLGITRASLEYYEKGKRTPDVNTIVQIADYFDVSVDYLLGRTECATQDQNIRQVCDFLDTKEKTVRVLKRIISLNKKNSEEFQKLISSPLFTSLLGYVFKSLELKTSLGEHLVSEYENMISLNDKSGEELYAEYGEDKDYSRRKADYMDYFDEIDLNEYRAQKFLLGLMDIFSRDIESSESFDEYVQRCVPNHSFFNEILNEIENLGMELDYKIEHYIAEQYYMDEDQGGDDNGNN